MGDADVVIVGGGFAGLALACHLTGHGRSVRVIERRTEPPPERRRVALQPNGLAALERMGLLDAVAPYGVRSERIVQCDPGGRVLARYDYGELDHPHPYLLNVLPADFEAALAERLRERDPDAVLRGCELIAPLEDGGIRYAGADGVEHELRASCVVGADGAGSKLRAALGIDVVGGDRPDPYVIGIGGPSGLPEGEFHIYCGRGFGNGIVSLGEETYFWDHVTDDNREAVEAGDLDGWRAVYERRAPMGAGIASGVRSWDELTVLTARPFRARTRIAPGAALIGDAAGTVHPHVGQGANLALEDAAALGDVLLEGRPLAEYARPRERKLRRYIAFSRFSAGSLDGPNALWRVVRRFGYLWSRVPPVRRDVVRRMAGLAWS